MSVRKVFTNGPAPTYKKLLRRNLMDMGVKEERLPKELKDSIVKRSKRGPVGAIVVRDMTGLVQNPALKTVRQFEANTGGKDDIAEKLSAVEDLLNEEQKTLLTLLKRGGKKSLAHLMADAKVEPVSVMGAYAKGCVALGKIQAAIEAHKKLPALIRDLYRHALDQEVVCKVCVGAKEVPSRAGSPNSPHVTCPMCKGSGFDYKSSAHKEFATRQMLEITKQVGREPGSNINVTQQVAVTGPPSGGDFLAKMLEASDKILYERATVVEGEVVPSKSD